jgi:SagB-type dehydrogenase family enzyme
MDAMERGFDDDFVEGRIAANRKFLRADLWSEWKIRGMGTPQRNKAPAPLLQKPFPGDVPVTKLVPADEIQVGRMPLFDAISVRRSRREFTDESLTLEEFSFLLWATQGVHGITREGTATSRTVPSGGARHPFETYLYVRRVEGLHPGLFRYLALDHAVCLLDSDAALEESVHKACLQEFVRHAAVVFIWTAVPYRTEWRYSFLAHKVIAQECGHLCQNLYLACESIGAGACALGTYDQDGLDGILGLDGNEEFAIYVGVVGKVAGPS